ncbi:MAG: pyrroline-5-carboxylate reductase [Candidatus Omnitrophica bacterium]|nr:pyrroline-5-carboxylate reductase [Candidatus Omnitrophota bacterium]
MQKFTVGIIGCGNMGSAIARGMVEGDDLTPDSISLYDKDIEKAEKLAKAIGASVRETQSLVTGSDVVILSIKPQDADELLTQIAGYLNGQLILSVMAGVTIKSITEKLGREVPVARAMPNMAAFVSQSTTSVAFNELVTNAPQIKSIFTGIGDVVEIEETLMDAVTALSGSGPAYLFYLAGAMIEAAVEMGIDGAAAEKMVGQTLFGASSLLRTCQQSPQELTEKVASKGGTTEAALKVFEAKHLKSIIKTAIKRAKKRSEELSKG